PNGVFDERLQNQVRHLSGHDGGIDVEVHGQSRPQARLFDFEIGLNEVEFLLERDVLAIRAVERGAQQIAEPGNHPVGHFDVLVKERRNGVERVEKKMRMQLHLQNLKLGLGELRLELRRKQLAIPELTVVVEHVRQGEDRQVKKDIVIELEDKEENEHI